MDCKAIFMVATNSHTCQLSSHANLSNSHLHMTRGQGGLVDAHINIIYYEIEIVNHMHCKSNLLTTALVQQVLLNCHWPQDCLGGTAVGGAG